MRHVLGLWMNLGALADHQCQLLPPGRGGVVLSPCTWAAACCLCLCFHALACGVSCCGPAVHDSAVFVGLLWVGWVVDLANHQQCLLNSWQLAATTPASLLLSIHS